MRRWALVTAVLLVIGLACLASACRAAGPLAPEIEPTPLAPSETPTLPRGPLVGTGGPLPFEPTPLVPETHEPSDGAVRSWYYIPNDAHEVPGVPADALQLLRSYGGRYTGPDPGLVYLTFDEGYENGNTPAILDALARNGVKATFFVTGSYVKDNPALVRRMVEEGHVVGNHTMSHPSLPRLVEDRGAFRAELDQTALLFRDTTGKEMARLVRPPMGEYSARSLWLTQKLGYESVFWSFAHRDWVVDEQPPVSLTVQMMLAGSHPGAIYLLHGVSTSDMQAIDAAVAGLRRQGYGFGTL